MRISADCEIQGEVAAHGSNADKEAVERPRTNCGLKLSIIQFAKWLFTCTSKARSRKEKKLRASVSSFHCLHCQVCTGKCLIRPEASPHRPVIANPSNGGLKLVRKRQPELKTDKLHTDRPA